MGCLVQFGTEGVTISPSLLSMRKHNVISECPLLYTFHKSCPGPFIIHELFIEDNKNKNRVLH